MGWVWAPPGATGAPVMMLLSAPVTVLFSELNNDPILLIAGALTTFVTETVSMPSRSAAAAAAATAGVALSAAWSSKPPGGLIIMPLAALIVVVAGAGGLGGRKAGALNGVGVTGGRGVCCTPVCPHHNHQLHNIGVI